MARDFYGRWVHKGIVFEMYRYRDGHLEMETYPEHREGSRIVFAETKRYIEPLDFLLYCQYNYDYET